MGSYVRMSKTNRTTTTTKGDSDDDAFMDPRNEEQGESQICIPITISLLNKPCNVCITSLQNVHGNKKEEQKILVRSLQILYWVWFGRLLFNNLLLSHLT